MSGDGPTQVEYGTLARIRSSADRQPPGSLHPGVSGRRSIGLLRDLRRSRHVVEPAPRVRVGPHRWEPDKQSPGKPAADLSELRLAATDVQKPESRPRSPPPPTAVRRQSVVLKSAPALPITPGWTPDIGSAAPTDSDSSGASSSSTAGESSTNGASTSTGGSSPSGASSLSHGSGASASDGALFVVGVR